MHEHEYEHDLLSEFEQLGSEWGDGSADCLLDDLPKFEDGDIAERIYVLSSMWGNVDGFIQIERLPSSAARALELSAEFCSNRFDQRLVRGHIGPQLVRGSQRAQKNAKKGFYCALWACNALDFSAKGERI
jgi:hypothetical protein